MISRFMRDPYYLLKHELASLSVLFIVAFLVFAMGPQYSLPIELSLFALIPIAISCAFGTLVAAGLLLYSLLTIAPEAISIYHFALIPLGICFGIAHMQLVHNCSHRNFRPRWLNRLFGELLSLQLFSSFLGFTVIHLEHHRHADDPDLDPHPNLGESFLRYMLNLDKGLSGCFKKKYFAVSGASHETEKIWRIYSALVPLRHVLRASVLLLILGPIGFCFFLIPSMIANHLTFGHLNYYSHFRHRDGSVEILNLNKHLGHKIMNFLSIGAYHHANHHEMPWIFNPAKVTSADLAKKSKALQRQA